MNEKPEKYPTIYIGDRFDWGGRTVEVVGRGGSDIQPSVALRFVEDE